MFKRHAVKEAASANLLPGAARQVWKKCQTLACSIVLFVCMVLLSPAWGQTTIDETIDPIEAAAWTQLAVTVLATC